MNGQPCQLMFLSQNSASTQSAARVFAPHQAAPLQVAPLPLYQDKIFKNPICIHSLVLIFLNSTTCLSDRGTSLLRVPTGLASAHIRSRTANLSSNSEHSLGTIGCRSIPHTLRLSIATCNTTRSLSGSCFRSSHGFSS